ncbi:MAG: Lysophospholipase 1 [Icmadophila ericetorum]|nr:Lysophospholipase 1 [Icmadophila ericetorum]
MLSPQAALVTALALILNVHALAHPQPHINEEAAILAALEYRALPNAPNGYTPEPGNCPSTPPSIREASSLSPQETSWLGSRRKATLPAMQDLLGRLNITGFDVTSYFNNYQSNTSALPNIGIAVSGGGYRAMLNGAGAIQAFDSRENNGSAPGHLGGLLQSATYLAGLSGGSWLVGSIFVNNFTTISGLRQSDSSTWQLGNSIFEGPAQSGVQLLNTAEYYDAIFNEVQAKSVDFNTTITDYWGRALSFQLINATDGGPSFTWSSISLDDTFSSGGTPMPVVISDGRFPNQVVVSANSTIYEFNPWEFGTFDPTTYAFAPLQFLGSNFTGGILPSGQDCVTGFDNAGYVMGTSSSLFNSFLLNINSSSISTAFKDVLTDILQDIGDSNNDIASYEPNPFYGFNNATSKVAQTSSLTLVDGGEDLQNIPLHPLIQPLRNVDVIFAVDSSADTETNWPNGTSLVATYERSLTNGAIGGIANGTVFPSIPDVNTFVNLGLNNHPTFFGCNPKNISGPPSPLIVYIPNSPYTYFSNVTTFDPSYNDSQRDAIIENGYYVATRGNATIDSQWPTCVGCAIMSRSWYRTGATVPDICTTCFTNYCWNGTLNATTPATYEPTLATPEGGAKTTSGANLRIGSATGVGLLAFAVAVGFALL